MTDDARRKILEAVAAGRMDPGEAADRLADIDAGYADEPETDQSREERVIERRVIVRDDSPVTCSTIKVDGAFRSVEVVGDDNVREAVADGPHRVRWEGDVLVIDAAGLGDDEDDERPDFGEWFRTSSRGGPHRVGMAFRDAREYRPRPLRVRVNPTVPLEARVEAGPLTIRRVRGPVKARVAAGPLTIEGFESPIDVRVSAGKVDARGRIDHGVSTIDCDAGKVRLHLEHGSDARVNASATLGKVDFGGRSSHRKERFDWRGNGDLSDLGDRLAGILNNAFSDEHEVVVGRGTGVIDIRVSMGAADITFDDAPNA
jgi:hypothetical protein